MRASAVATLFSLAAGASAFTVGGPAIVSRPVSFVSMGSRFLSPKIQNHFQRHDPCNIINADKSVFRWRQCHSVARAYSTWFGAYVAVQS